jgi:hypothetical protein
MKRRLKQAEGVDYQRLPRECIFLKKSFCVSRIRDFRVASNIRRMFLANMNLRQEGCNAIGLIFLPSAISLYSLPN